jgi:glycosyltransferase involved in cell wall biosynthesis
MPSVSEPFGITTLEAMKTGTPVLVSKQSGVSEVVRHALKVDFWDIDEMANKILALVRHPGLSETLSENAAREANHLTWLESARKVDSVIHEVV